MIRSLGARALLVLPLVLVLLVPAELRSAQQSAEDVLAKVRKKYDSITDAEMKFSQDVKFPMAKVEQHVSGTLFTKKQNKYRVELEGQTIVTDGETVWSYSPGNNQVLIDKFKLDERALSPDRILVGAPEDFTATLVGHEKVGKIDAVVVKLIPRNDQSMLTSLKLWINEDDWMIRRAEVIDLNGRETTYTVHQARVNVGLPDNRFIFQIPEGADVVDMR